MDTRRSVMMPGQAQRRMRNYVAELEYDIYEECLEFLEEHIVDIEVYPSRDAIEPTHVIVLNGRDLHNKMMMAESLVRATDLNSWFTVIVADEDDEETKYSEFMTYGELVRCLCIDVVEETMNRKVYAAAE